MKKHTIWGQEILFYRHTLCEVTRLVDIAATADGYMVGKELEGDNF